jgi:hypothetical protein
MNEFMSPLLIGIFTAILTALITIQIKYAATKEEALDGLKKLGLNILNIGWVFYLIYRLYQEVSAEEPLGRSDVFEIVLYAICLTVIFMMHIMKRFLSLIDRLVGMHEKHIDATGRIVEYLDKASKP